MNSVTELGKPFQWYRAHGYYQHQDAFHLLDHGQIQQVIYLLFPHNGEQSLPGIQGNSFAKNVLWH